MFIKHIYFICTCPHDVTSPVCGPKIGSKLKGDISAGSKEEECIFLSCPLMSKTCSIICQVRRPCCKFPTVNVDVVASSAPAAHLDWRLDRESPPPLFLFTPPRPRSRTRPDPSRAPSPWRRTTFFPTGSRIVAASPHARGPGTPQQAGGRSKGGGPTAAACRSSSQLQFVIIIKGLTSEASLPLFTPPSHP